MDSTTEDETTTDFWVRDEISDEGIEPVIAVGEGITALDEDAAWDTSALEVMPDSTLMVDGPFEDEVIAAPWALTREETVDEGTMLAVVEGITAANTLAEDTA